MAKQLINVGTTPNDGTGDTLRDAGIKVNNTLTELYDALGTTAGATTLKITTAGATAVGDALRWNGTSFAPAAVVADTNTTYGISSETATGGVNLRLTGSDASTDNVKIASGTNVSVVRTDADTITVNSTDTNTTYNLTTEQLFAGQITLRLNSANPSGTNDIALIQGDGITLTSSANSNLQINNAGVRSVNGQTGAIFMQPAITFSFGGTGTTNYTVTGPGLAAAGEADPTLFLYRGFTYRFTTTIASQILEILDSSNVAPAAAFISSTGATRNEADQNETVTFTVPMSATPGNSFKYRSKSNPATMLGTITVV
jgi:hypothetical protein